MAGNRSRRGGAVIRSSGRKTSVWAGATSSTPTAVTSDTAVVIELVPTASLVAIGIQGYIARTRGQIQGTAASAGSDPMVLWGVGVFNEGLTTAAAFPQLDDETREPYFAWGSLFCQSAVAFEVQPGGHMQIDSKGRRRFQDDERVVLMLKGLASGHTANIMFDVDVLIIPDQGA